MELFKIFAFDRKRKMSALEGCLIERLLKGHLENY